MTATGVDSMYWLSLSLVTLGPLPREDMVAGHRLIQPHPPVGGQLWHRPVGGDF
jgi:hypothetical protein